MKNFILLFTFGLFSVANSQTQDETAKRMLDSAQQVSFSNIGLTKKLYEKARKNQAYDTEFFYEILFKEGQFLNDLGEFDRSEQIFDTLLNVATYKGQALKEKGIIAAKRNDSEKAIKVLTEAISLFEKSNDSIGLSAAFKILGNVLFVTGNNAEARAYFKRSARIAIDRNDPIAAGLTYNNIARTFNNETEIDSAIYYNNKILAIVKTQKNYSELMFMGYLNDADFKSRMGNYEEAVRAVDSAFAVANFFGVPAMKGAVHQINSFVRNEMGDFTTSVAEGEKALEIFKQTNQAGYYQQTLFLLQQHAANAGNYQKAYEYLLEYTQQVDSSNVAEVDKNLKELRLKYESAENELTIAEQKAEIVEKETQNKFIAVVTVALAILLLSAFFIFRQRQKTQRQQIIALENETENIALKSLLAGEEKERSRFAKELHDGLGGILAVGKMHASKLEESSSDASEIKKLTELLDTASIETRRISHNLLPENLLQKGLDAALNDFVYGIRESKLLNVTYQSINLSSDLPQQFQLSVYRIIQELLNNITKHSQATEALVQLQQEGEKFTITVEDNGRGFSPKTSSEGIGFTNIKSRLSLLQGTLEIDSDATDGTSVYIELQLQK
ncbi:MAG: ATP-binding protein [Marinirhabdus sp.]|nr:ATP-binding protein [Marinirhabdus sp.]